MSIPKSHHKVYLFMNDFNDMCAEVYNHQHIETGGNLFGLWTASGDAMIHVVLGPGENCKRTSTSFHQDLEYMARVGRFVNEKYMLCHIGEWHSHHNLSLSKPSAGDESTIRRNFPQGMSKFLVIIANIRNGDTIKLSPYFFTNGGTRYEIAEYKALKSDSPFSTDVKIMAEITQGAEGKENSNTSVGNHSGTPSISGRNDNTYPIRPQVDQSSSLVSPTTSVPKPNQPPSDALVDLTVSKLNTSTSWSSSLDNQRESNAHTNDSSNTRVAGSTPPSTTNPSQVKPRSPDTNVGPSAPGSRAKPSGRTQNEPVVEMDADDSDLYPRRDYEKSSSSHPPKSQHDTPGEGQDDPQKKMNVDKETPSEREIIMRKIHNHLKYLFGRQTESVFEFKPSKDSRDVIEISFKHGRKFWLVRFPKDFPGKPAQLFCSRYQENVHLDVSKVFKTDIVAPLNNDVNILLSIKNRCDNSNCDVCKRFTKESLSQYDFSSVLMEKLHASASKLEDDITKNLHDVNDLKVNCCSDRQGEITFKHGGKFWIISITAFFPDVPANVYYLLHEKSAQKHDALLPGHANEPLGINSSKMIIKTILMSCPCTPCMNARPQYYK